MYFLASLALPMVVLAADPSPTTAHPVDTITVQVESGAMLTFTADDLGKLERAKVETSTDGNLKTYEGIPLANVLRAAGIGWGAKCSKQFDGYVIVEATDHYRVVFSLSEIDPERARRIVLIADRCDGKPLEEPVGPYQIIEQDAKQPGRWVRQVASIKVLISPDASSDASADVAPPVLAADASDCGAIHLVGMGPGDPELVTMKAARILKEADCVFCFDYLQAEVARFAPPEKITVASALLMGRFRGQAIEELPPQLQDRARRSAKEAAKFLPQVRQLVASGKKVVFADAGDPTVYCPWSWVMEDFADLEPIVVPGLSSFNAANATLRQSVTKKGGSILLSAGDDLGTPDEHGRMTTMLVLFTHRVKLNGLLPRLQSRYPADTPIAVVSEASYEQQQVIFATLGTILEELGDTELPHLYLIYVGDGLSPPQTIADARADAREGAISDAATK